MLFYCTFGVLSKLHNYYVVVSAKDLRELEERMYEAYGGEWGMAYTESEFDRRIRSLHMTEIPFGSHAAPEVDDEQED